MIAHSIPTGALRFLLGGCLEGDESLLIGGASGVAAAAPHEVALVSHAEKQRLKNCRAGLLIVREGDELPHQCASAVLSVPDPERAFDWCRRYLRTRQEVCNENATAGERGICLGAGCAVSSQAAIGAWAVLYPCVTIAAGAAIGPGCVIRSRAILEGSVQVGACCEIGAGALIGSECEHYEPGNGAWRRVPGAGSVIVGDEVSIGPLTVVEKGFRDNTRIGSRSIVGGQVYISHDCAIGTGCLLIGQTGLASEVVLGDEAALMARAAVNSQVHIGNGALVFGSSTVFGDVPPHAQVLGYPARPRRQALKAMAVPRQVDGLKLRLARTEKQLRDRHFLAAP